MEIKNAKIKSTSIEIEDHGFLTAWLHLDYGGSGQGFGGYALGRSTKKEIAEPRKDNSGIFAAAFLREIMETVGVYKWDELVGKTIRVKYLNFHSPIIAIGNIIEDRWFDPKALANQLMEGSK
jgi:hypothetical protein